jgi:hypothetical protein
MQHFITQLTFINSHKVRKHLSTALGLIDLIDIEDPRSVEEIKLILHYLRVAMHDLDEETRNMSVLLYDKKEQSERTFESSFYDHVKNPGA